MEKNARIKKAVLLLNYKPIYIFDFLDTDKYQIGFLDREVSVKKNDTLTLEILDVYPGTHYQDLAVSELFLNLISFGKLVQKLILVNHIRKNIVCKSFLTNLLKC